MCQLAFSVAGPHSLVKLTRVYGFPVWGMARNGAM